jgi:hypothetical protein
MARTSIRVNRFEKNNRNSIPFFKLSISMQDSNEIASSYKVRMKEILATADLEKISCASIRRQLEKESRTDLSHAKKVFPLTYRIGNRYYDSLAPSISNPIR